jgi:hypothetical protein
MVWFLVVFSGHVSPYESFRAKTHKLGQSNLF